MLAMNPACEAAADPVEAEVRLLGSHEGRSFPSLSRWSPGSFVLLAIAACGTRPGGVTGTGSNFGTSSGVSAVGASTGAGAGVATGGGVGWGSMSGTGTGSTTGNSSGASEGGGGSGSAGSSGTGSTGMSGSSGTTVPAAPTFVNYELTGTWPTLIAGTAANPIKQTPGALTYRMVQVQPDFLAESCAIGDYNADGIPDISSGRRWYEGPDFTSVHIFRGGHDALPRTGAPGELQNGVSDDWADYPWDVDGDGWTDIVNIASPTYTEALTSTYQPMPQPDGTSYWYKNPGTPANVTDSFWTANLMSSGIQMYERGLVDVDGDGKPEIFAACLPCAGGTEGYYEGDWGNPTAPWTFHVVAPWPVELPFGEPDLVQGLGFGDVNGDGKPDLLERSGVWLQPATGWPPGGTSEATNRVPQAFSVPAIVDKFGNGGGSHMYAVDVDGDGLTDVISADSYDGWGLSWYQQLAPGVASCVGSTVTATGPAKECFAHHQIINTNSAADLALYGVAFSAMTAVQVVDMDGDGLPDIVTGKMYLANPYDQGDPDSMGTPVVYVFKLVRDANPPQSGKAHFEPHLVNAGLNTVDAGPPNWVNGSGIGRQIAIGQINPQTDGIMDICIASKLGLYVYFGQ